MKDLMSGKVSVFVLIASLAILAFMLGKSTTAIIAKGGPSEDLKMNVCEQKSNGDWEAKEVDAGDLASNQFAYGGPVKDDGKPDNKDKQADIWCENNAPEDGGEEPETVKVTLCHWDNGHGGEYQSKNVDINSVAKCEGADGHAGIQHQDGKDIIPSFTFGTCTFNGQNLDKQSWIANGCKEPTSTKVDCAGSWSTTDVCSKSCGGGFLQEVFTVTTEASNGGAQCEFSNGQTRLTESRCNTQACENGGNNTGDVCWNLDGVQTSVPDGYHKDTPDGACNQYQLGGPPAPQGGAGSVLGASTTGGKVLGASTMAKTGGFEEMVYEAIMGLGAFLTLKGTKGLKKAKKVHSKK